MRRAHPLFPFRLASVPWLTSWLWATVIDYYGAALPLVGVICATEDRTAAVLWSSACLLLGSPFCCAYVAQRAWRHGTVKLSGSAGASGRKRRVTGKGVDRGGYF